MSQYNPSESDQVLLKLFAQVAERLLDDFDYKRELANYIANQPKINLDSTDQSRSLRYQRIQDREPTTIYY